MQSRLTYVYEDGKKIPFIDLSGWHSLEGRLSKHTSPNKDITSTIRKGIENLALDFYLRNPSNNSNKNLNYSINSSNEYNDTQNNSYNGESLSDSDSNSYPIFDSPRITYLAPESKMPLDYQSLNSEIGNYQIPSTRNEALSEYSLPSLKQNLIYRKSDGNDIIDYSKNEEKGKSYALPEDSCCKNGYCLGFC